MDHFRFRTYLTTNIDINETMLQTLLSHCNSKRFDKGSWLLREGEIATATYFVLSGLLRQYSIDEKGHEHTLQFAPENWFVANRESEFLNTPSSYYIQAIETTEVLIIEKELIQQLSEANAGFVDFNNALLHKHIASLQKRVTQLLSASAKARYLDFIKTYPDVLLRVPQTYVASYLGIAPESLSRIRKELAEDYYRSS